MQRHAIQRLRLAVQHAQVLDLQQRRARCALGTSGAHASRSCRPDRRAARFRRASPRQRCLRRPSPPGTSPARDPPARRRPSRCGPPAAPHGLPGGTRRSALEKSATSGPVSPANGSSTSTTFGLRATALASSSRRRSAKGSVFGRRCSTSLSPTRSAISRARWSICGAANSRTSKLRQQRQLDVLQHGLPVQRTRMLEHDADTLPSDAVRRPAGDVDAIQQHPAIVGLLDAQDQLHHGRFAGSVRPDQSEDLPRADLQADVVHRDQAAEALADVLHIQQRPLATRAPIVAGRSAAVIPLMCALRCEARSPACRQGRTGWSAMRYRRQRSC